MTSKPCWYCRGLPKIWWWLATLIGLPLLFFFMISDRQGPVEGDLDDRVRQELIDKEVNWADVNLKDRGRDVMLSGAAPDEAARDLAVDTAKNVYGVRAVEHNIAIMPLKSPELSIKTNAAGKVTLQGLLPSQEHIDSTLAAAGETFGADNIDNQLGIGERLKESGWLGKVGAVLPALAGYKLATLDINDDGSTISGTARSDEAKGNLLQQAKELLGGKLEEDITVKPLQAANFATQMADGKMTLSGLLPTQQNADNLVSAAAEKIGAANITNEITVSDDAAEASWLGQAQNFLGSMSPAIANANIADGKLTLEGTVNSYQAHVNALGTANTAIAGSELTLQDNIKVEIPAQPEAKYAIYTPPPPAGQLQGDFADGKLTLSGSLASQEEIDAAISAANTRVGADNVVNQLTINPEHSAASWLSNAGQLLANLPTMQGAMSISDSGAIFSGKTETNEDYMRALRQARSAMQNQDMIFENNVILDTSRLDQLSKEKAEQERLAREKAEQERLAREKAEQERLAKEKAEREEQERLAKEKAEREEQERLAKEKAEREEQERLAKEKAEREEQERLAKEKAEREEQERLAKEKAEREEQERLAKEKAEREEQERLAREAARLSSQVAGTIADGKLTLAGTLQSQQEVDTVVSAAGNRVGADNVVNRLTIDAERQPAQWLENAGKLLTNLPAMKGSMVMNDDKAMFRGTVETNGDYITAIRQARGAMQGQAMAFENNVVLDTSRLDELARLAAEKAAQAERERLAREKAEREEQERLAKEKAEREEQERLAKEKAEREEQERLAKEKAEREEQERLAKEKAEREEQERLAREAARPSGEVIGSMSSDGKLTLTGTLNSQDEVDAVVAAAEIRAGAGNVINQLNVDAEHKPAPWLDSTRKLVISLPTLKGIMFMNNDRTSFSGTEETKEDYINAIRKARWSMQDQSMAFENKVKLDTSRLDELARLEREAARPSGEVIGSMSSDGKLTLTGTLNSQNEVDAVVYAAETRAGADNVINQLNVDAEHKPAPWLDSAKKLVLSLPTLKGIMFMNNDRASFSGTEETKEDYISTIRKARWSMQDQTMAFENKVKLDTSRLDELARLAREAARPSGAIAGIMADDGKLTLTGTLHSQEEVDAVVYAAETRAGADNVINQLEVDDEHKPAPWLDSGKKLLLSLPTLKGIMSINNDRATFRGTEETKQDYISTIRKARWSMKKQASMDFENNVTLDTSRLDELARLAREAARPSGDVAGVMSDDDKLTLTGTLNNEQEVGAIIDAANIRVGEENIINQLKVDAEHKPAIWLDNAKKLLISLPPLKGKMSINNDSATFSGTTETREDYIGSIRQGRWSMQDQPAMAFENNVILDTSRLDELARLAAEKAEREKQARLAQEKLERQQTCQTDLNQMTDSQTILFATNKAEIKTESYDLLFELASIINACEDDLAGKTVTIGGHTDSDGKAAYNLDLSQRRAGAVLQYLQNAGISSELLEAKGFGEDQPVADNSTAEGKSKNRRITFEIRGN